MFSSLDNNGKSQINNLKLETVQQPSKNDTNQQFKYNPKCEASQNTTCTLDQLFEQIHSQKVSTSTEDLIIFENTDRENLKTSTMVFNQTCQANLPVIQEEVEEEGDEHSRLVCRLITTNYIQKTAITNFIEKKVSL